MSARKRGFFCSRGGLPAPGVRGLSPAAYQAWMYPGR